MTPGKGIQVNDNRKKNDPGSFTSGLDDLVGCDVVIGGGRGDDRIWAIHQCIREVFWDILLERWKWMLSHITSKNEHQN